VRDNLAAVLEAAFWGLAISATVLAVTTAAVTVIAGYWTTHCAIWAGRRMRHRRDVRRMRRRPARKTTASDQAVLGYLTIRTAWNQPTREEIKP
jgi:peptidoglycan/LPS O-acetylase OafA/YrhL